MNLLTLQIQQEIAQAGPISFARFMDLALYAPALGYYERQSEIGRAGDFYTSVSVGELFGQMLAFQMAEWLGAPPSNPSTVQIVEIGAHKGSLAADILKWLQAHRPEWLARIEYWLIEPSPTRREWQRTSLGEFLQKIRWADSLSGLRDACHAVNGIIFSNELLDAMPAHRLRWNAAQKSWDEWRVGCDGGHFNWQPAPLSSDLAQFAPKIPAGLAAVLPDGFTTEISPAAIHWWRDASRLLKSGKLLTLDYGLSEEEFLAPERGRGTLRAYSRHRVSGDLLGNVGEQDLTAHINFTALQRTGEAEGLRTQSALSQSKFLTQIFERTLKTPAHFEPWTPPRVRQFQTLTHPEHLGRAFRVLVQSR